MILPHYIWLVWASSFLLPWILIFACRRDLRTPLLRASLGTLPFALTEPLFVGFYWSPPSLFGLAHTTRFDLESFVFCFAIGGLGAVLYNAITRRALLKIPKSPEMHQRLQFHVLALMTPALVFPIVLVSSWSAITAGLAAMAAGALVRAYMFPVLRPKITGGGALFLTLYVLYLCWLEWLSPGFVHRVWTAGPRGAELFGLPVTELFFALGFGLYWSGIYEQITFTFATPAHRRFRAPPLPAGPPPHAKLDHN